MIDSALTEEGWAPAVPIPGYDSLNKANNGGGLHREFISYLLSFQHGYKGGENE